MAKMGGSVAKVVRSDMEEKLAEALFQRIIILCMNMKKVVNILNSDLIILTLSLSFYILIL